MRVEDDDELANDSIPENDKYVTIDKRQMLSNSVIWDWQDAFYENMAVSAWSSAIVPSFVTTNMFVASQYAKLILAFLNDWFLGTPTGGPKHCSDSPVVIVEVGAGHGKLGFLILTELLRLQAFWPPKPNSEPKYTTRKKQPYNNESDDDEVEANIHSLDENEWVPFRYIMTDFNQDNIDFWKQHASLIPFTEKNILDFSVFNAETDSSIFQQIQQQEISRSTTDSPIVAIFNYVFDTLKQDAFKVIDGVLHKSLCTTKIPERCTKHADGSTISKRKIHPDAISKLRFEWHDEPVEKLIGATQQHQSTSYSNTTVMSTAEHKGCPRYQNPRKQASGATTSKPNGAKVCYYNVPEFDNVLQRYVESGTNMSIVLPIGGLRAIRNLQRMSGDKVVILAGDKAYSDLSDMYGLRSPHIAVHGSFSFMANFHALHQYAELQGGFSLTTPYTDGFKCTVISLVKVDHETNFLNEPHPLPIDEFSELRLQWTDSLEWFGPDNLTSLQRCIKDEIPQPSLKLVMSLLRLCNYDSDVFYRFKEVFINGAARATKRVQHDLVRDCRRIASCYYPLQANKDVAFELGRLSMGLKDYVGALEMFNVSQRVCGEHHVSWYNMGICSFHLGAPDQARECFQRSLVMRADYHDARVWKARLESLDRANLHSVQS